MSNSNLVLVFWLAATVISVQAGLRYRPFTIINNCDQTVRVGRTGGQCLQSNTAIYGATGCPSKMTLNPANNYCYWDIMELGNGTDLNPGQNFSFLISAGEFICDVDGVGSEWSGNIWASTGCSNSPGCDTGICFHGANNPLNGYCPDTFSGPKGPVTRAEFTLTSTIDTFDVSSIDGINLPIEFRPGNPGSASMASDHSISGIDAQFWCGNPGGVTTTTERLGNCSWSYDFTSVSGYGDETSLITIVARNYSASNQACNMDSDCPDGQVCGVLQELDDSGGPGQQLFPGKCGRFIGIWTANAICAWASGLTNQAEFPNNMPFECMTATQEGLGTFGDLQQCAAQYSSSGYTSGECIPEATCGCANWEVIGIAAPATQPCNCSNPLWTTRARPWLEPIKRACPTSYSYSFDDPSSTFQCSNNNMGANFQDYIITFCPAGVAIERVASAAAITYKLWILTLMLAVALAAQTSMVL